MERGSRNWRGKLSCSLRKRMGRRLIKIKEVWYQARAWKYSSGWKPGQIRGQLENGLSTGTGGKSGERKKRKKGSKAYLNILSRGIWPLIWYLSSFLNFYLEIWQYQKYRYFYFSFHLASPQILSKYRCQWKNSDLSAKVMIIIKLMELRIAEQYLTPGKCSERLNNSLEGSKNFKNGAGQLQSQKQFPFCQLHSGLWEKAGPDFPFCWVHSGLQQESSPGFPFCWLHSGLLEKSSPGFSFANSILDSGRIRSGFSLLPSPFQTLARIWSGFSFLLTPFWTSGKIQSGFPVLPNPF